MVAQEILAESFTLNATGRQRFGHGLRRVLTFVALVLVLGTLAQGAWGQTVLVGSTTTGTQVDGNSNGRAEAYKFTATGTGTIGTMSLFLDSSNTATKVFIGLYTNATNKPGTLLTSGSSTTLTNGALNTIAVTA